jgi:ATP-dependent DNA helicase RecQ
MRNDRLHQILKDTFGYPSFRLRQAQIIDSVLDGRDTLGIMPTGGGKSLCYQVPALYLDGVALVVSPLISLMQDQVMNLKETGVRALFLNSTLSGEETQRAKAEIRAGKVKLVYVSPEGILSPHLADFFAAVKVSLIAIDEAHCVSQWGHEFRKDYTRLGELKPRFPGVPVIALTATADAKTRADIAHQLRLQAPNVFVSSFDRPNIKYLVADRTDELRQLDRFIRENHPEDTGIVYCLSRDKVERVAEALRKAGHPAVPYHAGLATDVRSKNQKRFNEDERIIVVATVAFGMGIDRPDVRFVAHLDLPKSIEGYYQETGRAGRDGKPSTAWMVYGLQDVVKLSQMIETSEADENYKIVARQKLDRMLALCETAECRRRFLLEYFGEATTLSCDYCDTCLEPPVLWDATKDAQMILSTIFRTQQTYGAAHVIDVLRGSKSARITEKGHDRLSVYGIGKEKPKEHWDGVLRQLLNANYVAIKNWEYRNLCLTPKAGEILRGETVLRLRKQEFAPGKKRKKEFGGVETTADPSLLAALKDLRSRLARERGVPPYVVFSDKSLASMCELAPATAEEFLEVHGVGQSKLETYGEAFLAVIRDHR